MRASHITTALCLAALFSACAIFKKAAEVGGPAAGGGAVGAFVGGPVGAGIGAAAGAMLGDAMNENDDLREGDLIGEGAAVKYKVIYRDREVPYDRPVPQPFIPRWIWWGGSIAFLYFRGHKILNAWRLRTLSAWLEVFLPKRTIVPKRVKKPHLEST